MLATELSTVDHKHAARKRRMQTMILHAIDEKMSLFYSGSLTTLLSTLLAEVLCCGHARATSSDDLALDYLIQKVCEDRSGVVRPTDPYDCPADGTIRPLMPGESLPYHRTDQPTGGLLADPMRHDSYPARTPDGREIVVNPFDRPPFGEFNPSSDGYDITQVRDGWASVDETRDQGGFSTTFFGANCKPYGGWVFFPVSAFVGHQLQSGSVTLPISGAYWEHNSQPWPGRCPTHYQTNSLTSWEFLPGFKFGGIGGAREKTIDTIRSVHGFSDTAQFRTRGHLEVFYFTRLYGLTRWEAWSVDEQVENTPALRRGVDNASQRCSGPSTNLYHGIAFARIMCRDWSVVNSAVPSEPPPIWPVPDLNLLQEFHFSENLMRWSRAGESRDHMQMNLGVRHSSAELDRRFIRPGGDGVTFLTIDCGGTCSQDEMLYQLVPIFNDRKGLAYSLLATLRAENGNGTVQLRLAQLDGSGTTISEATKIVSVGDHSATQTGDKSVLLSATSIAMPPVIIDSRAKTLRAGLSPLSGGTFDVIDLWLLQTPPGP